MLTYYIVSSVCVALLQLGPGEMCWALAGDGTLSRNRGDLHKYERSVVQVVCPYVDGSNVFCTSDSDNNVVALAIVRRCGSLYL